MSPASCPWSEFQPGTIAFCEERLCAWIVEPANAWSNLGYILAGLFILWTNHRAAQNSGSAELGSLRIVGIASVLVGLGSFAFHATGTFIGEVLDVSAMYLISGLLVVLNLRRLHGLSASKVARYYWLLVASSSALLILTHHSGIPVFVMQVIWGLYLEWRLWKSPDGSANYRNLTIALALFAAAFGIWILDITGIVCDPANHLLTGHAIWHLLGAAVLVYLYKHHEQFSE